uniref:Leucine-rich repeat-containing N-terminal plant-type domain-containing protein n=1 Tax=Populus trichocarpa TaxID=3694 RepID=A0A2K2B0N5_POPTR
MFDLAFIFNDFISINCTGWCEMKNLKQLDLSENDLGGSLPYCLGNLSSLQLLDVSENQFTGNIAFGPLTNLISLEFLSLSNNLFEVPTSMKPFMNHSSLKFFCNENNRLVIEPAAFDQLIPKFQLVFFSSTKTTEALNIEIPNFLYYQYHLRFLDLSHNNITGMFPSWLLKNNTRLEQLYLSGNSFVGTLQLQDHPYPKMTELDISNNNMSGQIPKDICLIFPNLKGLRMAKNGFTGCIPSCLGNISSLRVLDLSNNQLSTVKLELLTTLMFLKLSNNNLGGQIPTSVFNSSTSEYLYLGDNNFWGQISDFPLNGWKTWIVLDLSNNQFSGMLPRWFVNSTNLRAIDFSKNHFKGPIPKDFFCKFDQLEYLDLSENNLFGYIPSCFNSPQITHVHLSKNRLSGPLKYGFYNSSSLVTMDLRDNSFTGSIPNWAGNLSSLSVLLLRANHFDGEFPVQLCLLKQLSILDVSQNQLSGPLPSCLENLTFKESSQKALVNLDVLLLPGFLEKAYYEIMGPPQVDSIYTLLKGYWTNFTEEVIEFTTKNMYYGYKGKILIYMSGIDLSNNNFVGAIPPEFGNLSEILSLNLSHNNLTGSIPATFSNLKRIESLDLSYNNLNGDIPPQLTEMTTLEVFSVEHNNLSGKTPERKYQFGTFDESCYEGNPFLCGPPLRNNCSEEVVLSQPVPHDEQEDDGFIDMEFFYISFSVCYTVVVMTIAAVLYINPYWRRRWLYFIEDCIDTCYYFMVASFRKFSNFRR